MIEMNIDHIRSVLLQLNRHLQHVPQQPQKQTAGKIMSNQPAIENINKTPVLPPTVNVTPAKEGAVTSARPQVTAEVFYLPLPLKSDFFKSASFFLRQYQGGKNNDAGNNPGVFIKIDTFNLGLLWIGIESNPNRELTVRFFAENDHAGQTINEVLPGVKSTLKQSGYSNIVTTCRVQPNVQHCQNIDPLATDSEVIKSLLDWEV